MDKEYEVLLGFVQDAMRQRHVRDIIWHILSLCGLYSDQFSGNREHTDYLLGQRSIGLAVLQLLEDADPSIYPRLLLEMNNLTKEENNARTE